MTKQEIIEADFIVTEGAAFTPEIMKRVEVSSYMCLVPTPEFQISHYKMREWVCTDKESAFDNWMQRDVLFANQVRQTCNANGVTCFVNDGSKSPDEVYVAVIKALGIK